MLLERIASAPRRSRTCVCSTATPPARWLPATPRNRTRFFTVFLQEGYSQRPAAQRLPEICPDAIAGAIHHIIRRDVGLGDAAKLPQRLPELAYIALAPFTGPAKAADIIEGLSARSAAVNPVALA